MNYFAMFRPFRIYIDHPRPREISTAICIIDGWFSWKSSTASPVLRVDGLHVSWAPVDRPDVRRARPGQASQGFRMLLDISRLPGDSDSRRRITLQLSIDGRIVAQRRLGVTSEAIHEARVADADRQAKREWLKEHVACPLCPGGAGELEFIDGSMRCGRCGETYPASSTALNFLPEDLREQFHIDEAEDISAHHYDPVALDIVEEVRRKGGKVLDCGAGLRPRVDAAVVCLEVIPLPSTDVLAVNQKLPFRNAVFDAVFSLNVLEHVTDPFASAAELVRVLKPGGTLYCCIPFLQPEHGYPHHYFNATRSGLKQLFPEDFEVLQHVVPGSGEPVWALHWFLSWYAQHLPAAESQTFLQLRIKDILEKPPLSLLGESWVQRLSDEGKWKLASTTAAVFRKPISG